jgi:anaerobic ribonucleoside-triphosphate reductase
VRIMSSKPRRKCGCKCEVYSRVVGYMRPVSHWNKGKKEEFKDRKTFDMERTGV